MRESSRDPAVRGELASGSFVQAPFPFPINATFISEHSFFPIPSIWSPFFSFARASIRAGAEANLATILSAFAFETPRTAVSMSRQAFFPPEVFLPELPRTGGRGVEREGGDERRYLALATSAQYPYDDVSRVFRVAGSHDGEPLEGVLRQAAVEELVAQTSARTLPTQHAVVLDQEHRTRAHGLALLQDARRLFGESVPRDRRREVAPRLALDDRRDAIARRDLEIADVEVAPLVRDRRAVERLENRGGLPAVHDQGKNIRHRL